MTGCEGQDWASYQSSAPSTKGLAFVLVKATEGTGYVNPKHAAQIAHVRAEGAVPGHYHFQRPGSPTAQAAYFLEHAAPKPGDILACDWEDTGVSDEAKDQFIRAVQKAQPGLRTVLYCNRDFWLNRDDTGFCGDGLWIADPSAAKGAPRITAPWLIHQYSEAGGLDRDYSPLSAAEFRAWANKEDDVALTTDDINKIAAAVWDADLIPAARPPYNNSDYYKADGKTIANGTWQAKYAAQTTAEGARTAVAQIAGLTAAVQVLAGKVGSGADTATIVAAVQEAVANAVVHVTVTSQAGPTA